MAQDTSASASLYFIYLLLTATLAPLLFGYHLAELNAPSEVITCAKPSSTASDTGLLGLPRCIPMSTPEFGLVQSIFTLGGLLGALSAAPVSGKRGRLFAMRMITIPIILGPFIAALASSVPVMVIGRFLSGIGAGATLVVVPIYVSEIAPPAGRGFYGAFTQIMTNTGIFVTQLAGYWLSKGSSWRIILAIAGVIGIVQLAGLVFAVESPKWLLERGRKDAARHSLSQIRGTKDIEDELQSWKSTTNADDESQGLLSQEDSVTTKEPQGDLGFFDLSKSSRYRPVILAVLIVMASQQLTGINSIVMYGVSILRTLLPTSSALLNIGVSLLNIIATTVFAPLTDTRLGRKGCLLTSISVMAVSAILLAIGIRAHIPILSAITVLTFVTGFAIGLGPVPFMLASELVDTRAVSAAQSWALTFNWIATFIVAQFFPIVNNKLGEGNVYFLFAGLGAAFFLGVWRFVPETQGRRGMDKIWGLDDGEHDRLD